ncbi:uncharacterized protein LOC127004501 [Eriocheir sinensis]|uniref:uncharacterized protein LOC127003702 n=1 Tax=Eriocheir sinensis TaxID=95602 RepID=UPI0021C71B9A|nr:uncharacterized protein LOC127003702 [Eriocheir sinensis]XP_050726586.1 uncharacterized protein LOC127003702 [Eriocheir sinensis]XP_050728242.1 uncharacterized protein LOC127004501 [Eriocheir sinensis]XP_050728250.1 uncharacterized protein LOC127004501 [Eriocheir sinensis]XP_050728257.1 uncharacterized protein LOC127004501 [Eriocheir sinensis]XP_050728267.1 uncharacterized protein LOC127004501 [Eriocheir sinensis]
MNTSTQSGPDQAPTLIRISPKRIKTQVTQTVRYRPVRSLLLLGLLVLVSLFVLFTLSQMAVVQHTMMAHLGRGVAPGLAGGGGGGAGAAPSGGGGRGPKGPQRPWRSQFNQFKIEPLLVRNAPSVEVNSAMATNRRVANQVAAIIVRNSLLVSHSAHSTPLSSKPLHPQQDESQTYHVSYNSPSQAKTNVHSKTLSSSLPNGAYNSSSHVHLTRSRRQEGVKASHPIQRASAVGQGRAGVPVSGEGGRTELEEVKGVKETIRTGGVKDGSDKGKVRRFTASEAHVVTKTQSESLPSKKRVVKAPVFTLRGSKKQKMCYVGAINCNGQNSSAVRTNIMTNGEGKVTNTNRSSEKAKHALRTNKTSLLGTEGSNSTNTKSLPEHLYLPESTWYEPIDSDGRDLVARKSDAARRRNLPPKLSEEQLRKLPLCPEIPPGLMGHLIVDLDHLEKMDLEDVLQQLSWVSPGGSWSPVQDPVEPCLPRHKVAVVLPYRDRLHHLIILLSWLHPILRRQQLEYTVYVAEQTGNATFNKGSIMNAGFMEAWQRSDADCFVFHDVDLLPEDDRNMYSCPPHPRHLSVGVDTLGYKLPYFLLVGGVLSVRGDQFLRLNGYSNMYWGWGGEDDDMGYRIKQSGLSITRPANWVSRYTMIRHTKRRPLTWKVRGKLLRTSGRRYRLDGLNTLKYTLQALHRHPLFTHLLLDVGTPPENLLRLDAPAHPPPTPPPPPPPSPKT